MASANALQAYKWPRCHGSSRHMICFGNLRLTPKLIGSFVCMTGLAKDLTALAKGDLNVAAHVRITPPSHTSKDVIGEASEVPRDPAGR